MNGTIDDDRTQSDAKFRQDRIERIVCVGNDAEKGNMTKAVRVDSSRNK